MRESLGDHISADNAAWTFGDQTPAHFDTHISRSVPFYQEGHALILQLADYFLQKNSVAYDLGCSTGQLTRALANQNAHKSVQVIGVDSETAMIEKAKSNYTDVPSLEFVCASIAELELKKSDLIVCYYTLQFIHPKLRQEVLNRLFQSLNWGGALILFEKVRAPDARFQDIMTGVYTDYKLAQHYSPEEIVAKSRSLKGVLEPFSTQGNLDLLKRAGFIDIMTIMKYVCFEGFLAIK